MGGLALATYDVVLYSKPKGVPNILGRYVYITGPMMGIATAFTTVTFAATKLRGKDDGLNYFLGGVAAGGVLGSWCKSFVGGCVAGLFLGRMRDYIDFDCSFLLTCPFYSRRRRLGEEGLRAARLDLLRS